MKSEPLPGADLVERGLRDLADGRLTVEALLIRIGAPRLRRLGLRIPQEPAPESSPELALYALLAESGTDDAHARYNALIRRLVSFEQAKELELSRRARGFGGER